MNAIRLAGIFGTLAVILGAFGAHGLREHLDESRMKIYQTAVQYHFWHVLALLGIGAIELASQRKMGLSTWSFGVGIILFSGSLYLLALSGAKWLGAITPLGGMAFILGWIGIGRWVWLSR